MIYCIISNLDDAIHAMQKYKSDDVCLLSPIGGGVFLGARYWHALLQNVKKKTGIYPNNILHCGESIGAIQLAQSLNIPVVIYMGEADLSHLEKKNFTILTHSTFYVGEHNSC